MAEEAFNTEDMPMTSDWPVLDSMGVTRHHEITHYSSRPLDGKHDVLRIFYKRSVGSLLPVLLKYEFGRSHKTVVVDSGSAHVEETFEVSSTLLAAVDELDRLLGEGARVPPRDTAEKARRATLEELDHLHDAVLGIATDEDAEVLDDRFASLRGHIDAL